MVTGNSSVVTGSYSVSNVTCTDGPVGAFLGAVKGGSYTQCAAYGNINKGNEYSGGFAGSYYSSSGVLTIDSCYHIGMGTELKSTNGFCGYAKVYDVDSTVNHYYSFGNNYNNGLLLLDNGKTLFNGGYFYSAGCQNDDTCLTGYGTGSAPNTSNTTDFYSLDSNDEPAFFDGEGNMTGKLIDRLNADIATGETQFVRATCKVDIGEGEKDYILPIIPTIKPDFCTIL